MTDAEIKYAIEEYVDAKWNIIEAELRDIKASIEEGMAAATAGCLNAGDSVAIRACNGQVLCAVDGGPTSRNQVFKFESRAPDAIGPHETFTVLKP